MNEALVNDIANLLEKCLKKDKEIERLNEELEKYKHSPDELNEIERLNNIINEAIEYIQDRYDGEVLTHTFDKCNVGELLEILKKEKNNESSSINR